MFSSLLLRIDYLLLIIFNSILSQIPNHCILHAGVVSWQDKGIVLCGGMKGGKSTLTLGLVQNGFKFLSDEVAFIDLATSEVTPFPRVLGLREDALERFPKLKGLNGRPI
jgi:serine kinase of HPr protein (carbohydrate metabolism regulator)